MAGIPPLSRIPREMVGCQCELRMVGGAAWDLTANPHPTQPDTIVVTFGLPPDGEREGILSFHSPDELDSFLGALVACRSLVWPAAGRWEPPT